MDEKDTLGSTDKDIKYDNAEEKLPDASAPIKAEKGRSIPLRALAAILAAAAGALVLTLVLVNARNSDRQHSGGSYPERQYSLTGYQYSELTYDYDEIGNKYPDLTGLTAKEFADSLGYSYDEFLMYYRLPQDMPESLNANAAMNITPLGRVCELREESFTGLKDEMGWDDSISVSTAYGVAMDKTSLRYAIGATYLDDFKYEMGLGDDVTADTLYGDIRAQVEQKRKEMRAAPDGTVREAKE